MSVRKPPTVRQCRISGRDSFCALHASAEGFPCKAAAVARTVDRASGWRHLGESDNLLPNTLHGQLLDLGERLLVQAVADERAKLHHHLVADGVVRLRSSLLSIEKTSVPQNAELFRHVCLGEAQGFDDLIYRHGPLFQFLQDCQSRGLRERPETRGDLFKCGAV